MLTPCCCNKKIIYWLQLTQYFNTTISNAVMSRNLPFQIPQQFFFSYLLILTLQAHTLYSCIFLLTEFLYQNVLLCGFLNLNATSCFFFSPLLFKFFLNQSPPLSLTPHFSLIWNFKVFALLSVSVISSHVLPLLGLPLLWEKKLLALISFKSWTSYLLVHFMGLGKKNI